MFDILPLKGGIGEVNGFYCDGVSAGFKENNGLDLAFIRSDVLCDVTFVLTENRFKASPLRHLLRYPKEFKTDFLLLNSKNANAMTGEEGIKDIERIFNYLSKKIKVTNPIMSSTGVIGYRLDTLKIIKAIDKFDFEAKNSDNASKAIMTTDRWNKQLLHQIDLKNGESFRIGAIAKGAGMINPSLATMLSFIVTDASIPKKDMEEILREAVEESFNRISVDGDTSTNDTVFLLTNRKSKAYDKEAFKTSLKIILKELALSILRDGEGANRIVAFEVLNAKNREEAKKIAEKLSNSLLVKTALFGGDPNWGRIASTIGASGCECDEEKLIIKYDDLVIYSKDKRELDREREERAYQIMKRESFKISCDIGVGDASYVAYGCDLSYEYVKINAEYRT